MANGEMELPGYLRTIMTFIDRVGFPVLAFILMFYMAFVGLNKMSTAMDNNCKVMTELVVFEKSSHETLNCNDKLIVDEIRRLK